MVVATRLSVPVRQYVLVYSCPEDMVNSMFSTPFHEYVWVRLRPAELLV